MPGDLDSLEETSKKTSSPGCGTAAALQFEQFWGWSCNLSLQISILWEKSRASTSHNKYNKRQYRENSMHYYIEHLL